PFAMTMSPSNRRPRDGASPDGNDSTSVAASFRRYRRFNTRLRASPTTATWTTPRARGGAARSSHAARPGAAPARPRSSATSTRSRGEPSGMRAAVAVRERLVRLHDLLHQLVADDVAVVEVDERDAVDRADDLHRLDEARHASGRQI